MVYDMVKGFYKYVNTSVPSKANVYSKVFISM